MCSNRRVTSVPGIIRSKLGEYMKRSLSRKADLVTFSADVDQADALVERLTSMFAREGRLPVLSISAGSNGESLSFDDFADLRAADGLPTQFTEFRISLRGPVEGDQYGHISIAATRFGSEVSATGPTPGWCAGAVEEVAHFAKRHHKWIPAAKFSRSGLALLVLFLLISFGLSPPFTRANFFSPAVLWVWAGVVLALLAVIITSHRIPLAILRISGTEPWWRRYQVELTLGLATLTVIIGLIALWH